VARERERQAMMSLEEARRQVAEEVQTSLLDLQAATTNLALAEEQRAAAEAEYEQVFDLYRSQEATSLDVDSSETTLADARRAATNSRLLRKLAEVRVWFAAGSLKAAVQQEVIP
jgi:outer membrane protein TolC